MEQMTKKHNETGRSMVEMLGVLAIVGVLSIGGVAGYRYAVDKMNANEIINELKKRAITASQQRVLDQGINLSEYGVGAKIKGTYTVTPTDNYNGNASQFALEVAGVPERVCDMILESDWALPTEIIVGGTVVTEDTTCVEDNNDMTFAFNNTLESGDVGNGETSDVTTEATTEVTAEQTEVTEPDESVSEEDDRCGEHGTWDSSTERCTCSAGWGGPVCSVALCSEHGTWDSSTQQCVCEEGWTGNKCSVEISCNGHGTWDSSTQQCVCDDGWSIASFCSAKICQHGTWNSSTKECVCDEGWCGTLCSFDTSCNGHGTWNPFNIRCTCDEGWTGNRCDRNTLCSGHGMWNGSSCECDKGYAGDDCSLEPYCRWTGWLDSYTRDYTKTGGDFEPVVGICENGWVADIQCRAPMFPSSSLDELGQPVMCDTELGLVCYNREQFNTRPPYCVNYEINVLCCS